MMGRERILVIEDEVDILDVIEYNLAREGFAISRSTNGEQGLEKVRNSTPDLVLLDLMLPGLDGLEVCRIIKSEPATRHVPIIIVSAKGEESDVVLGLGLGADDYIPKPFSTRELVARVKAVLRRSQVHEKQESESIVVDNVVINASKHKVTVDDETVYFTATEFRLLHFLASNPGRVFSRDQLLSRAVSEDIAVIDRNIDVHVRAIRKKLGEHRELIETMRGVGYRFKETD